jgi:hypothetical protein
MSTKGVPVRLFMARVWLPRMRKVTAATVGIVVLVAFVAGMYVSGPEYVKSSGQTVSTSALMAGWRTLCGSQLLSASAKTSATALIKRAASSSDARPCGSGSNCRLSGPR